MRASMKLVNDINQGPKAPLPHHPKPFELVAILEVEIIVLPLLHQPPNEEEGMRKLTISPPL